jgi:hypothetical protein
MTLVLLVSLLAVGVGLLSGGRLVGIAHLRLEQRRLLVLALLVQVLAWVVGTVTGIGYAVAVAVTAVLAGMFCIRNLAVPGVPLMTLGLVLNFLVVAANGAMPVSLSAAGRAGLDIAGLLAGTNPRYELATDRTALPALGDVIPVALPWRPEVVSVGDVLLAAGLALLIVTAMRTAAPTRDDRETDQSSADAVVKPVGAAIHDYPDPGGHVAVDRPTTRDKDSTTTGSYS